MIKQLTTILALFIVIAHLHSQESEKKSAEQSMELSINNDLIIMNENTSTNANVLNNDFLGTSVRAKSIEVITLPIHGVTEISKNLSIRYTPHPSFIGDDFFAYKVCTENGECGIGSVTIQIDNVEYQPQAVDDHYKVPYATEKKLDILANDGGLGDLGITITIVAEPQHGTLEQSNDFLKYKSNRSYEGDDSFIYKVCDVDNDCSEGTVSLTIQSPEREQFLIPNTITPNGDGKNDYFYIPDFNLKENISISIYNQWGNVVFEDSNYHNNWGGESNIGISSGEKVASGTYFYKIVAPGWDKPFTGYIYIH